MRRDSLKRILLPGIILQSVLIGGGYATGREIVEYGAKFGAMGWVSGLSILIGFSGVSILSIEACRQWRVYDYKSLLKKLIGRGWIAYEIIYLLLAILTIAVMASAAGEILNTTFGFNPWVGIILIILVVGFLNYKGDLVIAKLETIGTIALFATYLLFAAVIFSSKGAAIWATLQRHDTRYMKEVPGMGLLVWTGILYVGYNLGIYPASFFTYKAVRSKRESILAGLASGVLMTLPWFLTYFAMLAYYPDRNILAATVPWLMMLREFHPAFIAVFGIVVGWTLIETATGMIHAFISRIDQERMERKGVPLPGPYKAMISAFALIAALGLAQVGIIDLVAKGYGAMAYAMIAVYGVPLVFFARRLMRGKPEESKHTAT